MKSIDEVYIVLLIQRIGILAHVQRSGRPRGQSPDGRSISFRAILPLGFSGLNLYLVSLLLLDLGQHYFEYAIFVGGMNVALIQAFGD